MASEERNYTVEIEHGAAVVRVFRSSGMAREQVLAAAKALLAQAKTLTRDENVHGLVLDLRRLAGAVSPEIEAIYAEIAKAWEFSGQPIALLSLDPMQKLQLQRIVSQSAPRLGTVTNDRNDARRFVGANRVDPDASSADLMGLLRSSRPSF